MPHCIIEVLETHRKSHKYSQFEMATLLHVSQPTYNNWINRRHKIDLRHYPTIATLCGVSLQDLLPPEFGNLDSIP